ncbi:MAG: hypothetical protein OHK0021_00370 [Bryobacter sp.]
MPRNLILVAGHAIVRDFSRLTEDAGWFLLDFQRGEPTRYLGHIESAVRLAAADPDSLLIFSGGPTRLAAGPRTEALSYWLAAEHFGWWGHPEVAARAHCEDFARDSFENLLFGLCRFEELSGQAPAHVTFVSWEFKRQRFEDLHRAALHWPAERFTYVGANDPPDLAQALAAEAQARAKYAADPYSASPEFQAKKQARNPFRRQHGYQTSCPHWFAPDHPWKPTSA